MGVQRLYTGSTSFYKDISGFYTGGFKRGSKFSETAAGFNVEVFSLISAISLNPAKTLNTVS